MAETDRAERLKAALRENLKRRKSQARGRQDAGREGESQNRPTAPKGGAE